MESSTTLNGRLLDLKQRYVRKMPERIAVIASTLAACMDGGIEAKDRLEREFHTLGGTAGTYDLHSVAAAAFEGEEACAELDRSPLDSDTFTYLTFLVDQLRVALALDASAEWSVRTVLIPVDAGNTDSEQTGVSAA